MLIVKRPLVGEKEIINAENDFMVIDYLERHDSKLEMETDIYVNNVKLVDDIEFEKRLGKDDILTIVYRPSGVETAIIIAVITAVALISLIPEVETPNEVGSTSSSPNNSVSGQTNTIRKYEGIPNIYGRVVSYPDLIQNAIPEWVSNRKQVTEVFLFGEGEYEIPAVLDDATDLNDIAESSYTIYGPNTAPSNLNRIKLSSSVNDEEIIAPDDDSLIWTGEADFSNSLIVINSISSTTFTSPSTMVFSGVSSEFTSSLIMPEVGESFTVLGTVSNNATFTVNTINEVAGVYTIVVNEVSVANEVASTISTQLTRFAIVPKDTTIASQLGLAVSDQLTTTTSGNLGPYTIDSIDIFTSTTIFTLAFVDTLGTIGALSTSIQEFGGSSTDNTIGPFSLSGTAEEIWFNVNARNGLQSSSGGKISVSVDLYIQQTDGQGNDIGLPISQTATLEGSTTKDVGQTIKFTGLGGNFYDVYTIRTTGTYSGSAIQDIFWEEVFTVNSYSGDDFGDVTTMEVITKAALSGTSSSRKINAEVTRVIDGVATTSFADAVKHLITVKGGRPESEIDVDELDAIADGLSDDLKEFSFTFDDKNISLGQAVQTACNVARVNVYRDGQTWRFNRDEAKQRTYVFNRRNLASGDNQTQTFSARQPQDYDSVSLRYYSRTIDDFDDVLILIDSDTESFTVGSVGARPLEIELAGCSNYAQALNRANLEARKLVYQRRSVEDTALIDASNVDIGDRVAWCDIYDGDVFDGEITGQDGNIYSTSERFTPVDGETYFAMVTMEDGSAMTPVEAVSVSGNEFAFEAVLSDSVLIADNLTVQAGSKYVIGKESDIDETDYSVVARGGNQNGRVSLELIQYSDNIYESD